ncbi:hypothetical protein [Streptomyces buecherae]|uniref:PLL-like beta propeller domain-containing protein n=1 Tax=Streptomyces buecherae TaxID=2763006 RepID=A0A7H8NCP4_9ACTN|nr:hypothetical protein [Streptomyces buecherae]QKW52136.1 hypothetical protein HUT08_24285 [Streptomyces buecherae]
MKLRRTKAVLVTAAAVAGLAMAASPARADVCNVGGGRVICEYGVSQYTFGNGVKQEFAIGTDYAVWTRWTNTSGKWNSWSSMGGAARSGVEICRLPHDTFYISVTGTDGKLWERVRFSYPEGTWSTEWERGSGCH